MLKEQRTAEDSRGTLARLAICSAIRCSCCVQLPNGRLGRPPAVLGSDCPLKRETRTSRRAALVPLGDGVSPGLRWPEAEGGEACLRARSARTAAFVLYAPLLACSGRRAGGGPCGDLFWAVGQSGSALLPSLSCHSLNLSLGARYTCKSCSGQFSPFLNALSLSRSVLRLHESR